MAVVNMYCFYNKKSKKFSSQNIFLIKKKSNLNLEAFWVVWLFGSKSNTVLISYLLKRLTMTT